MSAPAYTPAARRALARAGEFARRHGEIERFPGTDRVLGYVAADHLLLGVAHPDARAGIWTRLGLDAALVYDSLARALTAGVWPPPPTDAPTADRPDPVAVEQDATAQRALAFAAGEARRLGAARVGPEHLLLGALRVGEPHGQMPESLGRLALESLGVTLPRLFALLLSEEAPSKI